MKRTEKLSFESPGLITYFRTATQQFLLRDLILRKIKFLVVDMYVIGQCTFMKISVEKLTFQVPFNYRHVFHILFGT